MKLKPAVYSVFLLLPVIGIGCGALNRDANSLNITETIAIKSKLSIELEDKSGFNIDVQNLSPDTLVLERKGLDNLLITRARVTAKIEPNTQAALTNIGKRNIKVRVRVYDHKSKVVRQVREIKN